MWFRGLCHSYWHLVSGIPLAQGACATASLDPSSLLGQKELGRLTAAVTDLVSFTLYICIYIYIQMQYKSW